MAKNVGAIRVAFIADTAGFSSGMREMDRSFQNYDQMMRQVEQQQSMLNRSSFNLVSGLTGVASAFGLQGEVVSRTLMGLSNVVEGCSSMQDVYTKAQVDTIEAGNRLIETKKLDAMVEQQKTVESLAGVNAVQTYTEAQIESAKAEMDRSNAALAAIEAESQAAMERANLAVQEQTAQEEQLQAFKDAQKEYRAEYRKRLEVLKEGLEEAKVLYQDEVSNFQAGIEVEKKLYTEKMSSFKEQIDAQKEVVANAQNAAEEQLIAAAKVRDAEMEKTKAAKESALAYEKMKGPVPSLVNRELGSMGVPSWVDGMTQQFSEAEKYVEKFSGSLGGIGRSGKAAEAVLKSAWSGIAGGIGTAANAVVGFGAALVGTPVGWLTMGVAGLAAGMVYLASASEDASQKIQEQMRLEQERFDKLIQNTEHLKDVQAGLKTPGMIAEEGFDNVVKAREEQAALLEEEKKLKKEIEDLNKAKENFEKYKKNNPDWETKRIPNEFASMFVYKGEKSLEDKALERLKNIQEEKVKYPFDLQNPQVNDAALNDAALESLSKLGISLKFSEDEKRKKNQNAIDKMIAQAQKSNMYFGKTKETLDRAWYEQSDAYLAAEQAAKAKADADAAAAREVERQAAEEKRAHDEMLRSIDQRTEAYRTASMKTASEAEKFMDSMAKYNQWIQDQMNQGISVDPQLAAAAKKSLEEDYKYAGKTGQYLRKQEENLADANSVAKMRKDFEKEAAEKVNAGVWTQADANSAAKGFAEEVIGKLGIDQGGETETKRTQYLDTDQFASANSLGSVAAWKAGLDGMYRQTTIVSTMRENNNQNRELIQLARDIAGNISQKAKQPGVVG